MKKSISLAPTAKGQLPAARSLDEAFHAQLAKPQPGTAPDFTGPGLCRLGDAPGDYVMVRYAD